MRLDGKVAVIMGASAEGGTGWAIAQRFAAEGANVTIAARRIEIATELAGRINATAIAADATNETDVAALADAVVARHGRLDIAVNAAGGTVQAKVAETNEEVLLATMRLNHFAHVYFVREMARHMRNGGAITLFSSMAATQPIEWLAAYGCAKAATDCLVRYAALEYGPRNIRINSIRPGTIRTDQSSRTLALPGMEELLSREIPLGRVATPEDCADAALWLADSAFVTGLNLDISGGNQLMRFPTAVEREALAGDARTL